MHIATATVLHRVFTFDKSLSLTVSSGLISAVLMAAFITWHCMSVFVSIHMTIAILLHSPIQIYTIDDGSCACRAIDKITNRPREVPS